MERCCECASKKEIIELLKIRDRLDGYIRFHEMQPVSDRNMSEVNNLISTLRIIRDGNLNDGSEGI